MSLLNTILGTPFGIIIYYAYHLTNNYGLAIIIFALIVKIVLFPISILMHKNSIRLLQLQPTLTAIKRRYSGDKERLNEEQYLLFKKEKYSPLLGLAPLLMQLILIMGVLQVMYHPLQHVLRLPADVIEEIVQVVRATYADEGGFAPQLRALESVYAHLDLNFLGLNLGVVPSLVNPTIELFVPLTAVIAAFIFCLVQNANSPGALSQGERTNFGFTLSTVGMSLYFSFVLPVGVVLYWVVGNLSSIVVVMILKWLYPPKKLAVEALEFLKVNRKTKEELQAERKHKKELRVREKRDSARFNSADKKLVFYVLSGGQYKYIRNYIEYILENSDLIIHYLTNDPNDKLFEQANKRLAVYYLSERKTISIMLKLDADIFITTVPGLQNYHLKKSLVRDDIEYIYTCHGLASAHLVGRVDSVDHYNTLFCVGPHTVAEARRREEMANLPQRKLVKTGYGVYDQLVKSYREADKHSGKNPQILIAPSWQEDNILEICIEAILDRLVSNDYKIIIRPHPQYLLMFPERITTLKKQYAQNIATGEIVFDLDFINNESIFYSDIVISDWSNIALEFSYSSLRPSLYINTPMKVMNPDYEDWGLEVLDITLRDKVGRSVDVDKIDTINHIVMDMLNNKEAFRNQISQVVQKYLFYPLKNGEAGGRYLINRLAETTSNDE